MQCFLLIILLWNPVQAQPGFGKIPKRTMRKSGLGGNVSIKKGGTMSFKNSIFRFIGCLLFCALVSSQAYAQGLEDLDVEITKLVSYRVKTFETNNNQFGGFSGFGQEKDKNKLILSLQVYYPGGKLKLKDTEVTLEKGVFDDGSSIQFLGGVAKIINSGTSWSDQGSYGNFDIELALPEGKVSSIKELDIDFTIEATGKEVKTKIEDIRSLVGTSVPSDSNPLYRIEEVGNNSIKMAQVSENAPATIFIDFLDSLGNELKNESKGDFDYEKNQWNYVLVFKEELPTKFDMEMPVEQGNFKLGAKLKGTDIDLP